jgi:hypothetical protein
VGTGLGAASMPFYPGGWPAAIGAVAAGAAAWKPQAGLVLALAAPVLPLGNASLGLALVYAAVAAAWLALFARDPSGGLLPSLAPLLGPIGALALVPVLVQRVVSPARRAAVAVALVLVAAAAAGLRRAPFPLTGDAPPLGLGIAGSEAPVAVAGALWRALAAQPGLLACALAFAAAAAALPYARARGAWGIAALGAATMAAALLPTGDVVAAPIVVCLWLTCLVSTLKAEAPLAVPLKRPGRLLRGTAAQPEDETREPRRSRAAGIES